MIRYLLFARILGIVVLSFTASFLVLKGFLFIPALFGFCILALSVFLYKDQQKTVKRMEYLIESIHYGDLSLFYPSDSMTEDEKALASSMNAALEALRSRLYNSVVAEAETEAWQKLIRVLTHEIMNSIAPVISLSETVAERATINGMNEKDYAIMVQAMQTIHRRSKGLLDFVENYRKLTRLPLPTLRNFSVSALFDDIRLLFPEKSDILFFHVKPEDLNLYADRIMVMNHGEKIFDAPPKEVFRHYRELEAMGLAAPQITYIVHGLKEHGVPIADDITTVTEARDAILHLLGKDERP